MAPKKCGSEGKTAAARMRQILSERTPEALDFLVSIMRDEGQKPELRMKAAESILDRACGKGAGSAAGGGEVSVRFEGVLDEWSR